MEVKPTSRMYAIVAFLKTQPTDWWVEPNGRIRARGSKLDPICEAHRILYRRRYELERYRDAGSMVGLSDDESLAMVLAADAPLPRTPIRQLLETLIK